MSICFNLLSKYVSKVTVTMKDDTERTAKVTIATVKNSEITSKEDLIAIPIRIVPDNADNAEGSPALVTQLLTWCSSDGTLCRSHSPNNRTTSAVAFPKSKKRINKVVGKREMLANEIMPVVQMKGKIMAEIMSTIVVKQLRMLEERCITTTAMSTIKIGRASCRERV